MKSYYLPAGLAVLIFLAGMLSAVSDYQANYSISMASAGLILSALAVGVLTQRFCSMEKEMNALKSSILADASIGDEAAADHPDDSDQENTNQEEE